MVHFVKCLLLKPEFRSPANTDKANIVVCICTPSADVCAEEGGSPWSALVSRPSQICELQVQ